MPKQPTCSLCDGELVREQNVTVTLLYWSALNYRLAWVCTNCSAVFPAAVTTELRSWGRGRRATSSPLWEDGRRHQK